MGLYERTREAVVLVLGERIFESRMGLPHLHKFAIVEVFVHPERHDPEVGQFLRESYLVLEKYGMYKDEDNG